MNMKFTFTLGGGILQLTCLGQLDTNDFILAVIVPQKLNWADAKMFTSKYITRDPMGPALQVTRTIKRGVVSSGYDANNVHSSTTSNTSICFRDGLYPQYPPVRNEYITVDIFYPSSNTMKPYGVYTCTLPQNISNTTQVIVNGPGLLVFDVYTDSYIHLTNADLKLINKTKYQVLDEIISDYQH